MTEPILALHFLSATLVPDATLAAGVLGGWHDIAPAGVLSPYGIVRQLTSGADQYALDGAGEVDGWLGEALYVPVIMQVNLYDRVAKSNTEQNNFQRLDPLAKRVKQLLHRARYESVEGEVFTVRRVQVKVGRETLGDTVELYINQHFEMYAKSF